jgi:hypothetical protein
MDSSFSLCLPSVLSLPRSLCAVGDVQVCLPSLENRCEGSAGGCTPPCSPSHHSGVLQADVCSLIPSPPGHTLGHFLARLTDRQVTHYLCTSVFLPSPTFSLPSLQLSLCSLGLLLFPGLLGCLHGSLFCLWVIFLGSSSAPAFPSVEWFLLSVPM